MNMPNLPTDNLYKFLAISGVVILIFSSYIPYTKIKEAGYYLNEISLDRALLTVEIEHLAEDIDALENQSDKSHDQEEQINERIREMEIKIAILDEKDIIYDYMEKEYISFLFLGIGGYILGFLLATLGFVLWYVKLQVYQDVLIREKAMASSNEIDH